MLYFYNLSLLYDASSLEPFTDGTGKKYCWPLYLTRSYFTGILPFDTTFIFNLVSFTSFPQDPQFSWGTVSKAVTCYSIQWLHFLFPSNFPTGARWDRTDLWPRPLCTNIYISIHSWGKKCCTTWSSKNNRFIPSSSGALFESWRKHPHHWCL